MMIGINDAEKILFDLDKGCFYDEFGQIIDISNISDEVLRFYIDRSDTLNRVINGYGKIRDNTDNLLEQVKNANREFRKRPFDRVYPIIRKKIFNSTISLLSLQRKIYDCVEGNCKEIAISNPQYGNFEDLIKLRKGILRINDITISYMAPYLVSLGNLFVLIRDGAVVEQYVKSALHVGVFNEEAEKVMKVSLYQKALVSKENKK